MSTAKATFSGRSAYPVQEGNIFHRYAAHQQVKGLQKALRNRLQPESPAAASQLCSHGSAQTRRGGRSGPYKVHAAIAEPPMEVLEETFPRGASWEVSIILALHRHYDALYTSSLPQSSLHPS